MRRFNITNFSSMYSVRKLEEKDIPLIVELYKGNLQFFQYCGSSWSVENIRQDMRLTPPGKAKKDKYYVGYFIDEILVAMVDLIDGYPNESTAYIGFFMVNRTYQGKGTGSSIIGEILQYLKEEKMQNVRLGIDKDNPQSHHFWKKNGFVPIREVRQERGTIVVAERKL